MGQGKVSYSLAVNHTIANEPESMIVHLGHFMDKWSCLDLFDMFGAGCGCLGLFKGGGGG